jgi:hypothetical protein
MPFADPEPDIYSYRTKRRANPQIRNRYRTGCGRGGGSWSAAGLGRTLNGFQDVTLNAFGMLRDGMDVQIRSFGERLDHGVKATAESVSAISTKLIIDIEQMRTEANTGRENLRGLIEKKLDQNIIQLSDSAKVLREELGGRPAWNSRHRVACGNWPHTARTTRKHNHRTRHADRQIGEGARSLASNGRRSPRFNSPRQRGEVR